MHNPIARSQNFETTCCTHQSKHIVVCPTDRATACSSDFVVAKTSVRSPQTLFLFRTQNSVWDQNISRTFNLNFDIKIDDVQVVAMQELEQGISRWTDYSIIAGAVLTGNTATHHRQTRYLELLSTFLPSVSATVAA